MRRRTFVYSTITILSILLISACTGADGGDPSQVVSDPSSAAETTDPTNTTSESDSPDAGNASDPSASSDESTPSDSPTDPSGLETGPCEASLRLTCGTEIQVDSSSGQARFDNHPACDDTFRFPGKELRYFFESTFDGQATVSFQRDRSLTTTFMTFVYESSPSTCEFGNSCHAQADDYGQPLEFDVRDGYAYHIIWDPRLFDDTATSTLRFECDGYVCGDGNLDPGERCDDGNVTSGDGCSADCGIELGFDCSGEPSSCVATQCGDGLIMGAETCDDLNETSGDGCSETCLIEDGFHCVGEPSLCDDGVAGDVCTAAVEPTEEYIQGNTSGFSSGALPYEGACGVLVNADGPDEWYRFTIPPGKILSLEPYLAFEGMRTFVVEDCQSIGSSCLQTATGYLSTYLLNNTAQDKNVSVAVDGFLEADQGDYRIRQLLRDPSEFPQADHAINAINIGSGTFHASTEYNNNLYSGYGGDCLNDNYGFYGFSGGPDRVFAVEVAPGQTLTAEVTPSGGWDSTVAISQDAADLSASCLSWKDDGVASATNSSTETDTFYVIVDGFYSHNRGDFQLTTRLE